MFQILLNNTIMITRGDTAYVNLNIFTDNMKKNEYILQEGDVLSFTVKKKIYDVEPVISKKFTSKQFKILSEDTNGLDFGKYVYDVKLLFANGDVNTIIESSYFEICGEVT